MSIHFRTRILLTVSLEAEEWLERISSKNGYESRGSFIASLIDAVRGGYFDEWLELFPCGDIPTRNEKRIIQDEELEPRGACGSDPDLSDTAKEG